MQEDKEQVFDAAETLELAIAAMTGMVSDLAVSGHAMKAAAGAGYSTATDLADWLVREAGLPFREAHHVTGAAVALAEEKGCDLSDLALADLQAINSAITDNVYAVLTVEASVASRTSFGGTAPDQVRKQIALVAKTPVVFKQGCTSAPNSATTTARPTNTGKPDDRHPCRPSRDPCLSGRPGAVRVRPSGSSGHSANGTGQPDGRKRGRAGGKGEKHDASSSIR